MKLTAGAGPFMNKPNKGFLGGLLGASCCVLPLALIAAGLGGSVLTVFLVRYKTYLMALAVGVLAYAWYAYRRDAKVVRQGSARLREEPRASGFSGRTRRSWRSFS